MESFSRWTETHFLSLFYWTACLQFIAIALIHVKRTQRDLVIDSLLDVGDLTDLPRREKRKRWRKARKLKQLLRPDSMLNVLMVVLWIFAIGSIFWLVIPGLAYAHQAGHLPHGFTVLIFGFVFGFLIIMGLTTTDAFKQRALTPSPGLEFGWRTLTALAVCAFLVTSESLITVSSTVGAFGISETIMTVFTVTLCYLPIRLVLLLEPPVHWLEFISAIAAFVSLMGSKWW